MYYVCIHNNTKCEAECLSVREALSWLKDKSFLNLIVKMDAQQVFYNLSQPSFNSCFGLLLEDCKQLASHLANVQFRYVRRSANEAAHVTATVASFVSDCMV